MSSSEDCESESLGNQSEKDSSDNEGDSNAESDPEDNERLQIREDLKTMTFEEIMKLKEELGAKIYKEAILGTSSTKKVKTAKKDFKRLNKNRPREAPVKRPVPFLGAEHRNSKKPEKQIRDPRFDERAGDYDPKKFKENYQFVQKIRSKEVQKLKKQLHSTKDQDERKELKKQMQRLLNQNLEDRKWHEKQKMLKEEQAEIMKARADGKTPHFVTKKERRAKELVKQFEKLKEKGQLNKHLEKRRKKMLSKDRKKISFD